MAPTACYIDYPMAGSDATSSPEARHRTGRNGIICKRQRLTSKQFPKIAAGIRTIPISILSTGAICEADTPSHPMLPEANLPSDPAAEHTASMINRRKELLDIVVRTLALVRRNYILQVRLDSLRLEAKDFFKTVLNDPESKNFGENCSDIIYNDNQKLNSFPTDDKNVGEQIICIPFANETPRLISPANNQDSPTCISSPNDEEKVSIDHCNLSNI